MCVCVCVCVSETKSQLCDSGPHSYCLSHCCLELAVSEFSVKWLFVKCLCITTIHWDMQPFLLYLLTLGWSRGQIKPTFRWLSSASYLKKNLTTLIFSPHPSLPPSLISSMSFISAAYKSNAVCIECREDYDWLKAMTL